MRIVTFGLAVATMIAGTSSAISAPICGSSSLGCLSDDIGNSVPLERAAIGGSIFFADPPEQQLFNQAFWYRVGTSGGERRVDDLPETRPATLVGKPDGTFSAAVFRLGDPLGRFVVGVDLLSAGGTAEKTAFTSRFSVLNTSGAELDFHLFMRTYADLDVNLGLETPSDYDGVVLPDPRSARQISPRGARATTYLTDGATPDAYRVATRPYFVGAPPLRDPIGDLLRDGVPSHFDALPDTNFPYAPFVFPALGDQWAWEWSWTLAPGESQSFGVYNVIALVETPTPGSLALWLICFASAVVARRARLRPRVRIPMS